MKLSNQTRKYSELIDLAYASAEDPEPWYRFVDLFKDHLRARDVSINLRRKPAPSDFDDQLRYYLVTSDRSAHLTPEYMDAATRASERILDIAHPRAEQLKDSQMKDLFSGSALFDRFLDPLNIKYLMVMDVHRTDYICMKLSAERESHKSPFSSEDKELMEIVAPHLRRAMLHQSEKLGGLKLHTFYAHVLDKQAMGGILLDEHGCVISTNSSADELINAGTSLRVQRRQLIAAESIVEQQEFRNAISLAAKAARNSSTVLPGKVLGLHNKAGKLLVEVVVKPYMVDVMSSAGEIPAVGVIIRQSALGEGPLNSELLSTLYGFTKQEARVAALIGSGVNIQEIANEMGVSVNTSKTHLSGIYAKTGYNSQSQIVALVTRSLARFV